MCSLSGSKKGDLTEGSRPKLGASKPAGAHYKSLFFEQPEKLPIFTKNDRAWSHPYSSEMPELHLKRPTPLD